MYGDYGGAGATQFGGGGFMASQNDKGGPSPGPKNATGKREGLRAVTVKQLLDFTKTEYPDENQDLNNVTLVGKIIMMKTMQSNGLMEFKLYDGTGTFLIIYYLNEEDEMAVQKSAEWQVGTYVRVHGSMSEFNNVHRVQAFNVRAITDFNEITYHNLQAIFQHLHIAKGMPGSGRALAEQNSAQAGAQGGGGAMYGGGARDGGGGGAAMGGGGGGGGLDDVGDDGYTNLQRQVLNVIQLPMHADANREGATLESIIAQCPGLNAKQVQEALAFLSDQGAVYTTCDEYHFKAC